MARNVLLLAGGGGHTGYAYALAQRLQGSVALRILVPEGDALSEARLEKFGTVDSLPKPRGAKTSNSTLIPRFLQSFSKSLSKVSSQYDAVVSTGSNFCIPPALSSLIKRIPLVNIESSVRFTKASKTALILQPFSTITVLQWEEQKRLLPKGTVFGPLLPKPQIKPWNGGYILVTGGTLGHKLLFDTLSSSDIENIVLQTGEIDPKQYRKKHPGWKTMNFSTTFHELVAGADLVVTHFGSTALEALIYRKPMVIVLNPEWTRNAGRPDAEIFSKKVNASFVSDVNLQNLLEAIQEAKVKKPPSLEDGAENLARAIVNL